MLFRHSDGFCAANGGSVLSPESLRVPYRWAIDRGDNSLMPLAGSDGKMPLRS
jgi:hypothetical protein